MAEIVNHLPIILGDHPTIVENSGVDIEPLEINTIENAENATSILDCVSYLGHSALSYLREKLTIPPRLTRGLAVGLAVMGIEGVASGSEANAFTTKLKPSGLIMPVKTYYTNMLLNNANNLLTVQHVSISAHKLTQAGPCEYNSSGISLTSVSGLIDTFKGENETYCPPKRGGRYAHRFISRHKLDSNPSMNFQPLLVQLSGEAVQSVGLTTTSLGTPTHANVNLNPGSHESDAEFFYGRGSSNTGARQLKELKFTTHGRKETVHEIWY